MRNKVALGILALAAWLVSATSAWAVALGKIDVASHLGEPFYAEVPLQMDPGESISNAYVQVASPADYRILEVYRDPALDAITVDIKTDKRGARVVLSSDKGIEAPFFNLVLKVRYERATHFKKYPVFLDIPQMAKPATMKPEPTIKEGQRQEPIAEPQAPPSVAPVVVSAKPAKTLPGSAFKAFDGWARTARYGPMVYGDTITTVAQRLQIDNRFTRQQVMVALFEKNRAKFDHDNINLIKAGTYLDVPTAAEVEKISPEDAHSFIARQEKQWRQLVKQPKYAAVAEAQKHRYSKRVRVGEKAAGEAAAPMPSSSRGQQGAPVQSVQPVQKGAGNAGAAQKLSQAQQQVEQLQQQNSELQGKLTAAQQQMSSMAAKSNEAGAAAANAKVKRLQIQLARLQAQRDKALQQAKSQPLSLNWLTYVLAGAVVVLLIVVGFLFSRKPSHPAVSYPEPVPQPQAQREMPATDMFGEAPEIDVEEVPDTDFDTDFDAMATMQMNAAEVTKEFTDSIPDLTDEDTGKMEAFQEEIEEEPDPNVDYLAEADVYLRYGMEDEAVQQVKMALRLDPHNADAHIKLAQVLKAKNDQSALDAAMGEARQALGGSSLQRFEDAVANLGQGSDAFADTIPPTMAEEMPSFDEDEYEVEEVPAADQALTAAEPEAVAESGAEAEGGGLEGLDIEWPEFEDAETPLHEAEAEAAPAVQEETPSATPEQVVSAMPSDDMEFDLSDLEIPDADEAESEVSRAASFVDTSDLEKTVAIDWSQETSVEDSGEHEDILGDLGLEGLAEAPETGAEPAPQPAETPKPKAEPAVDDGGIDLGDFDFDQLEEEKQEEQVQSLSDDEFSSTIRTTSLNVNADAGTDDEPLFDLSSELEIPSDTEDTQEIAENDALASLAASESEAASAHTGEAEDESGGLLLDLGDDIDETQKLDDLLSEFADEGDKDGGDK